MKGQKSSSSSSSSSSSASPIHKERRSEFSILPKVSDAANQEKHDSKFVKPYY
jgi:hypothetical protein